MSSCLTIMGLKYMRRLTIKAINSQERDKDQEQTELYQQRN